MLLIIVIMVIGVVVGHIFRDSKMPWIENLTILSIWALLLLLGVEVGSNEKIMQSLETLGIEALVITIFATAGSVLCAWGLWRWIKRRK